MIIFSKLHPFFVHFPVALLISGVCFELYGNFQNEESVTTAGRFNITFGFWCALATMGIGILGVLGLEVKDRFRSFLSYHIAFALTTAALFAGVLILRRFEEKKWGRIVYHILLIAGLAGVLSTGYFGGELVHRFGVATLAPSGGG